MKQLIDHQLLLHLQVFFFNIKSIELRLTNFLLMEFADIPESNNACVDIIKLL